jgi:hypothetical protein
LLLLLLLMLLHARDAAARPLRTNIQTFLFLFSAKVACDKFCEAKLGI